MNHIYRLVFNRALGLVQVAPELASGRAAGGRTRSRRLPLRTALALALAAGMACGNAMAQVAVDQLPALQNAAGASVDQVGAVMEITQTEDRALIRWNTFDIGADALVQFIQDADQVALNQILDGDPSQIMGDLTAGGTIFLINPNGIVFGVGSEVNVGSLVASTLAPDNAAAFVEFEDGAYVNNQFQWNAGATGALVVNQGTITASGGQVVLLGADVRNAGTITVGTGEATLMAAGSAEIQLVPGGLQAVVPLSAVTDAPLLGAVGIDNTGTISAEGGRIVLSGQFAEGLAGLAVNTSGALVAAGIGGDPDGSITVASTGAVGAGGTINAGTGGVDVDAGGNVILEGALVAGNLDVSSGGSVQEGTSGALEVSGTTTVQAVGNIALNTANNFFGGTVELEGGTASILNNGTLFLGTVDADSLAADAATIVLQGDVTTSGSQVYGAGAFLGDDVILTSGNNVTFDETVDGAQQLSIAAGGYVEISGAVDVGGLAVDANSFSAGAEVRTEGNLSLSVQTGGIGQASRFTVGGESNFDAGAGDIFLANANNDFGGAVSLAGGSVTINDAGALSLGTLATGGLTITSHGTLDLGSGAVAGNLQANSDGGAITQSGALSVSGTSTLNADGASITLDDGNNDFGGDVSLTGGTVSISDDNALALGALAVGSLTAVSDGLLDLGTGFVTGALDANSGGGAIIQSGPLEVGGTASLVAGGDIALNTAYNFFNGTVELEGGTASIINDGTLFLGAVDVDSLVADANTIMLQDDVTSSGSQTYGAAVVLGDDVDLAAGGDVAFESTVDGAQQLSIAADGHVGITGAVDVGGLWIDAGSFSADAGIRTLDDLSLTVGTGGVGQVGAFVVGGDADFDAGAGDVTLIHADNDFGGAVSLAGDTVTINDVNALTLGTLAVGSLDARSHDALGLGQGTVTGNLVANSNGGAITQSGGLTIGGSSTIAAGAGDITLDDGNNDFGGAVSLTGGEVEIADGGTLRFAVLDVASLDASSHGALDLGAGSIAGDLVADSDGGAITQGGVLEVGGSSTLDAGAADITLLHDNDFVGAVSLAGGSVAIADRNQLTLGQVDAASLSASAATIALEQDIATTGDQAYAGAVLLDGDLALAAGGSVDFTSTVTGPHALSVMADGHVGFGDAVAVGGLSVDAGSASLASTLDVSGDLSLVVQTGGIAQSQAFTVGGQTSLDAGAIMLTQADNDFQGRVSLAGDTVTINDVNALTLGTLAVGSLDARSHDALDLGQGTVTGNLVADSGGGAITQSGGLTIGGSSTIAAGAGNITLDDGGNDFGGAVSLTGGVVEINDLNALTLGTLDVASLDAGSHGALDLGQGTVAGNLLANSDGGAIGQSGALEVGGTSTIDAGAGNITLADADNDFVGAVSLTGGAVAINDINALTLGTLDVAALDASSHGTLDLGQGSITGDLVVDSDGNAITQAGALVVGGSSAIDAGAGNITLVDADNDFVGAVSLAGGSVAINDLNALTLGTLAVGSLDASSHGALALGTGSIAGALDVDSGDGAITQSGALSIGGTSTIDAGAGNITLADVDNDFVGAVSLTGGAASIADVNTLQLGALDVASLAASSHGTLDLGQGSITGSLDADSNGGDIAQSGGLRVGGTSTVDAGTGDIVLAHAGNDFGGAVSLAGGAVSINDANALSLGTLDVDSLDVTSHGALDLGAGSIAGGLDAHSNDGAVDQSGALSVGGNSNIDAGTGAITLADAGNDFGGAVSLAGGAVSINDANSLALDALDVDSLVASSHGALDLGAGSIAGALDADSGDGAISQSGALVVGGTSDLDAGTGAITLADAGNDFGGAVGLAGASISLRDRNDLVLSHLHPTGDGDVHVTAGGALTLPAEAVDAGGGNLYLAAGAGALATRASLAGADVTLLGAGGVALGHDVDATGTLRLESGAGISQAGGRIEAAQLVGSATGEASLDGANRIDTLGQFSASGIALSNDGPLTVAGPVDAGSGSLRLALSQGDLAIDGTVSAADVRLEVAGGITQGDGGQLVAGSLSGSAGGAVVLGDADRFIDNRIERVGDFIAREGFSLTNGTSLTLGSLNGSDFTIDVGSAAFYLAVDGDLRQDGTDWLYNGSGTWSATGGIGLSTAPIYVTGLDAQAVAILGVPPAYFYAMRPDGSLLPIIGDAANGPTLDWGGRAQVASSRRVAYVDMGAEADAGRSNPGGYGLVEPGVRLPDDQQPECDPDLPGAECEETR